MHCHNLARAIFAIDLNSIMDFKSFCVENRGKLRPSTFPFFASSFLPKDKMPKSYDLPGISVGEAFMEENCFTDVHALNGNLPLNDTMKYSYMQNNQDIRQYDKFPLISKLIGGFVGSKSQGGSASREPFQMWDILRQVVNSVQQSLVQSHCCFDNMGNTVSPKNFKSLYRDRYPTYENSPYLLKSCDFLHNKGKGKNLCNTKQTINSGSSKAYNPAERQWVPEIPPILSSKEQTNVLLASSGILKQTYADVAKSLAIIKLETGSKQRQEKFGKKCAVPEKNTKDSRQTAQCIRMHSGMERNQMKGRAKVPKPGSRHKNSKQEEERNINNCVQEDYSFLCGMPEELCKNWRCSHTRTQKLPIVAEKRNQTSNSVYTRDGFKVPNISTRMPPHTQKEDASSVDEEKKGSVVIGKTDGQVDCEICTESTTSSIILEVGNTQCESHTSSLNNSEDHVRPRVSSECSVESEDSFVVFDYGECEADQTVSFNDASDDSGSESDCDQHGSDTESSDGDVICDEVDFCHINLSAYIIDCQRDFKCDNSYAYVSDHLRDINAKWKKENSAIPSGEKIAQKVRFATGSRLTKVHPLVKWEFAYQQARRGPWEEMARDRCRFNERIARAAVVLGPILHPEHRRKIQERRMCSIGAA